MADGIVGQGFVRSFRAPTTVTLDPDRSTKPDGSAFTPTITALGGDAYEIAFTPDQSGIWIAEATDADGYRYRGEYEIVPDPAVILERRVEGPDELIRPSWFNNPARAIEKIAAVAGVDLSDEAP